MQPVLFEFDVARWVLDVGRLTSMLHVTVRPAVAPYQLGVGDDVVVTLKIGGRSFAAQIAVDALIIDVEFARYVFSIFVRNVGHG